MPVHYADLLYAGGSQEPRIPLGARVVIGGAKHKVDKLYRGYHGTVVSYGHPASVYDHLVALDETGECRWFKPSEFASWEDPQTNADPVTD